MAQILEIRRTSPDLETRIAAFFGVVAATGKENFFYPHDFTPDQARVIANYTGEDFYGFALHHDVIIGYGLLRGWDEGYAIPSLGVVVGSGNRGAGVGAMLMQYLHVVATLRKCDKVRLRVREDNVKAKSMYEKLGYKFEAAEGGYLVGFLKLKKPQ